ncbi:MULTISPECIES: hypothetical protein [Luteibacter]|uniref:hypothetical protein n=1 Tax=Luteibacter TaxID=242605 RepID=UPI00068D564E|nr:MULTISPECIES: hypothetical protein [unclassified Luteibacter]MDR6640857.1 hypothetical protein [Luteibacter sp. 1214]
MRIAMATLIGGLVMFLWGAFAHMVLPLGEMSMRAPLDEDRVIASLKQGLPAEAGIYVLPHFDRGAADDEKARAAFSAKAVASPFAFIVYEPHGRDSMQMGVNLFHQWVTNTLGAWILALVMIRAGVGVTRGLVLGLAMGVFSWLSISVPYWNWYRFPDAFTVGSLLEIAFGWLLAGASIGWWLRRGVSPAGPDPTGPL